MTQATPPKAAESKDDAAKAAEGSQEKPAEGDKPAEGAPAEEQKTEPAQPVQQYETKQRTRKNFSKIKFSTQSFALSPAVRKQFYDA